MFDKLLQDKDLNKVARTVKKLKQWKKNRETLYNNYDVRDYNATRKLSQLEADNSTNKSMKKVYSVPMDIYMNNPEYWDDIIKNRKFDKHPEWKIENKSKTITFNS